MSDKPEGVKCACGEFTPFHVWVYAHWNQRIEFTCPKCKAKYSVLRGKKRRELDDSKKGGAT